MSTPFVSAASARISTTPNATMTTLASPTLSGSTFASIWQTSMIAGAKGPLHSFDSEQIVVVLEGRIEILLDGTSITMEKGSALTVAGDTLRQIAAVSDCRFLFTGAFDACVSVPGESAPRSTPEWIV